MDKLMLDYEEKFGEQFPLMLCRGMTEEAIKALIKKCIDEGKPYEVNNPDALY